MIKRVLPASGPSAANRTTVSRTIVLSGLIALTLGAACFEDGPLLVTLDDTQTSGEVDSTVTTDTSADTTDAADSTLPDPDSDVTTETQPPSDTSLAPDTVDSVGGDDTTVVEMDTVAAPACLTVGDCPGQTGPTDLCAGTVDCIDYQCVADPSTVVVCDPPTDLCQASACEPSTGACVVSTTCQCAPAATLACGTPLTFTTGDAGTTSVTSSYGCGGGTTPGPERTFGFEPSVAGHVRLSLLTSGGVEGYRVVGAGAGNDCLPGQCLTSSTGIALFRPTVGERYAIMVEETTPGNSATLTAECGITQETLCADLLDDDGDGQTDCDDRDCDTIEPCIRPPDTEVGLCFDALDNDEDGRTDCGDTDCHGEASCLQGCQVLSTSVLCGFSQGATTGGGKIRATDYSCGPPSAGKEVVYRFVPNTTQSITVTMSSGVGLALYVLEDRGSGCTPLHCIDYGPGEVTFVGTQGMTYFFAIDGPEGVSGAYQITVACD